MFSQKFFKLQKPVIGIMITAIVLLLNFSASAQVLGLGENVDYFDTTGAGTGDKGLYGPTAFNAESLYIGAPFLRDTSKPFVVYYDMSTAAWTGMLYLMLPDGSEFPLMSNHPGQCGTTNVRTVDLTNSMRGIIHHRDTVFFKYRSIAAGNCSVTGFDTNSRYTGPNRSPLDLKNDGSPRWITTDRFWSPFVGGNPDYGPKNIYQIGRRWSVAGWIRKDNRRTDTVQFAFEDGGDGRFNDIRYRVTGLFLMREKTYDTLILNSLPNTDTVCAGDSLSFFVKVFGKDTLGNRILFLGDSIRPYLTWKLDNLTIPLSKNPGLRLGNGPDTTNTFFATEAYESFRITITLNKNGTLLTNYKTIRVVPGKPHHLVIEGSNAALPTGLTDARPVVRDDAPLDSIHIAYNQTSVNANAVLRDVYGNFVRFSTNTLWGVVDGATIVGAASGTNTAQGQGTITKLGPDGTAHVSAQDRDSTALLFRDTIKVIVDQIRYDTLRVVNISGTRLSQLNIKLGEDTLLIVQGWRPDLNKWENIISGTTWQISSNLQSETTPPTIPQWNLKPVNVMGTGSISVTWSSISVQLPVTVLHGDPDNIQLYDLAGDPGSTVDPIPAKYVDPAIFPYPVVAGTRFEMYAKLFDSYTTWLAEYETTPASAALISWTMLDLRGNPVGSNVGTLSATTGNHVYFTSTKAWDTLNIIATIQGNPFGSLRDTVQITTRPGALALIQLELLNGQHIIQSTLQSPGDNISLYAIGYDVWHNKFAKPIPGMWSQDAGLHPVDANSGAVRIFYSSANVTNNESGYIYVQAVESPNGPIRDSVQITIIGPRPILLNAITRDTSGNGYLDGIELHFDKTITIPAGFDFADDDTLSISDGSTVYRVASITTRSGVALAANSAISDSVFIVHLVENYTTGLQTSMRPYITINGLNTEPIINIQSTDGAGPVITSVTRTLGKADNNTKDVIVVKFSEPIMGGDYLNFKLTNKPINVFNVWERGPNNTLVIVDSILYDINTFIAVGADSVVFYMSNGEELSTNLFLSIAVDRVLATDSVIAGTNSQVVDQSADYILPNVNNQRVGVTITNGDVDNLHAAPSPFKASKSYPDDNLVIGGPNYQTDPKEYRRNVISSGTGTVLTIPMTASSDLTDSISATLLIYDLVGNLVAQAKSAPDIRTVDMMASPGRTFDYDIYWNGTNDKGMVCSTGLYRVIMLIKSKKESKAKKVVATVGIR